MRGQSLERMDSRRSSLRKQSLARTGSSGGRTDSNSSGSSRRLGIRRSFTSHAVDGEERVKQHTSLGSAFVRSISRASSKVNSEVFKKVGVEEPPVRRSLRERLQNRCIGSPLARFLEKGSETKKLQNQGVSSAEPNAELDCIKTEANSDIEIAAELASTPLRHSNRIRTQTRRLSPSVSGVKPEKRSPIREQKVEELKSSNATVRDVGVKANGVRIVLTDCLKTAVSTGSAIVSSIGGAPLRHSDRIRTPNRRFSEPRICEKTRKGSIKREQGKIELQNSNATPKDCVKAVDTVAAVVANGSDAHLRRSDRTRAPTRRFSVSGIDKRTVRGSVKKKQKMIELEDSNSIRKVRVKISRGVKRTSSKGRSVKRVKWTRRVRKTHSRLRTAANGSRVKRHRTIGTQSGLLPPSLIKGGDPMRIGEAAQIFYDRSKELDESIYKIDRERLQTIVKELLDASKVVQREIEIVRQKNQELKNEKMAKNFQAKKIGELVAANRKLRTENSELMMNNHCLQMASNYWRRVAGGLAENTWTEVANSCNQRSDELLLCTKNLDDSMTKPRLFTPLGTISAEFCPDFNINMSAEANSTIIGNDFIDWGNDSWMLDYFN